MTDHGELTWQSVNIISTLSFKIEGIMRDSSKS